MPKPLKDVALLITQSLDRAGECLKTFCELEGSWVGGRPLNLRKAADSGSGM